MRTMKKEYQRNLKQHHNDSGGSNSTDKPDKDGHKHHPTHEPKEEETGTEESVGDLCWWST